MNWQCCWTTERISTDECPAIVGDDRELALSLKRRFLEKCIDCPRFQGDMDQLRESGHPIAAPLTHLIDELLDQRSRLVAQGSFLDIRNREFQFIHELWAILQTSMELDEVLSVAMTAITAGKGFGLNRAFLLLADRERNVLTGHLGVGPRTYEEAWQIWAEIGQDDFSLRDLAKNFYDTKLSSERVKFQDILERLTTPLDNEGHILCRALRDRKSRLVENAFHNPDVNRDLALTLGVDSFLIVPLISRHRRIGIILADNCITHRQITAGDLQSMETFAFPVAFAIERASLYERLQEELDKLTEANGKLKEQQELIVRMEKLALVGQITATITHSIRNPLMVIGGYARSLLRNADPHDPKRGYLESIVSEAKTLENVLLEVLTFSDSLQPSLDAWDLNRLVVGLMEELRNTLHEWGTDCNLELAPDLPAVFLDCQLFANCLRGIIIFSIDSMPQGGTLTLRSRREGDRLVLELEDDGQPFGEEHLSAGASARNETGIALSRQILQQHGIPVEMANRHPGGKRISIVLTLHKEVT